MKLLLKTFTVILVALIVFAAKANAQKKELALIDSMLTVLPNMQEDTHQVNLLLDIGSAFQPINPKEQIKYGEKAIQLAKKINWQKGLARSYHVAGWGYRETQQVETAIQYELKSLEISEQLKYWVGIGIANYSLGVINYFLEKDPQIVMNYYQKALAAYQHGGHKKQQASVFNMIGRLQVDRGELQSALEYQQNALKIHEEFRNQHAAALALSNIGDVYDQMDQNDLALASYNRAIKIGEELGRPQLLGENYSKAGALLNEMGDYRKGRVILEKALKLSAEAGDKVNVAHALLYLGIGYRREGDFTNAKSYLKRANIAFKEVNSSMGAAGSAGALSKVLVEENDLISALRLLLDEVLPVFEKTNASYNLGITYQDISHTYEHIYKNNAERDEKMLGLSREAILLKAIEYRDKAIDIYKKIGAMDVLAENYGKMADLQILAGNYKASTEYGMLYVQMKDSLYTSAKAKAVAQVQEEFQTERKDYEIKMLTQEKSIQSLKLREQLALLKQQELLASQKEKDLLLLGRENEIKDLELQKRNFALAEQRLLTAKRGNEITILNKDKAIQAAVLQNTQKNRNMIIAALLGLFLFSGTIYYYRTQRKNLVFQHKITETELNLFRSQMNPHFMFNALNSIHSYVITNERDNAVKYLEKFSELMHIILANSTNNLVSLTDDLKALELYLELEAERLNHKFSYEIKVNEDIDTDKVMVPPMILQPFLENSVWHGMLKKENNGKIQLEVGRNGALLECVITDNGNGFRKMRGNDLKSGKKSYGINITRQRIENLNKTYKVNAYCEVMELMNENQVPAGVKVQVGLPLTLEA